MRPSIMGRVDKLKKLLAALLIISLLATQMGCALPTKSTIDVEIWLIDSMGIYRKTELTPTEKMMLFPDMMDKKIFRRENISVDHPSIRLWRVIHKDDLKILLRRPL